jgi:hypothetical protein
MVAGLWTVSNHIRCIGIHAVVHYRVTRSRLLLKRLVHKQCQWAQLRMLYVHHCGTFACKMHLLPSYRLCALGGTHLYYLWHVCTCNHLS